MDDQQHVVVLLFSAESVPNASHPGITSGGRSEPARAVIEGVEIMTTRVLIWGPSLVTGKTREFHRIVVKSRASGTRRSVAHVVVWGDQEDGSPTDSGHGLRRASISVKMCPQRGM